ncbi:MAG: hypothetical protein ACXITV_08755 [Luteibaculaceae bacterium]
MSSIKDLKKNLGKHFYNLADELYHIKDSNSKDAAKVEGLLDGLAEEMNVVMGNLKVAAQKKGAEAKAEIAKIKADVKAMQEKFNAEIEQLTK